MSGSERHYGLVLTYFWPSIFLCPINVKATETDRDQIVCYINKIKLHHQMDDFMSELDEDVEGMQSTILLLQQQLRFIFYLFPRL